MTSTDKVIIVRMHSIQQEIFELQNRLSFLEFAHAHTGGRFEEIDAIRDKVNCLRGLYNILFHTLTGKSQLSLT